MALNSYGGDSVPDSSEDGSSDNQEYIDRLKKILKPLEKRWGYVQSVLLWEKPIHSLCHFIAMTALFCVVASGRFRVVLLLVVVIASSLLMDDVRTKVWWLLQQGGFGGVSDEDSRNSLSFLRLCERLAAIWSFFMTWFEKLNRMKNVNVYKYYGVLFGLLLVVVFAYQYLPLLKMLYLSVCALYFWPVIKHHGIHRRVKKTLEPFYMPFVVQWQHSRTKRQRDSNTKVITGEQLVDSDDEFEEDLQPVSDGTAINQDVTLQDEEPSRSDSPTPELPLEVRFLEKVISSAVTQGLNSITDRQDRNDDEGLQAATSGSSSPDAESFDSSAVLLDDVKLFPSISQFGDTLEFEDDKFMEGLEFPDIGKDSDSESEHIHPVSKVLQVDSEPKTVNSGQMSTKEPNDRVNRQTASRTPESAMTSSANMDVSDYEMLDQSEAEGITPTDETDNVDSQSRLGSVTNYVGKWLGY